MACNNPEDFQFLGNCTNDTEPLDDARPGFEATAANVVIAIVLTTVDVVTILGNLLVLLAFCLDAQIRQPFNLYIFNLAITDFLVAITAMTFYTIDTLLGYWPFGTTLCGLWIYLDFAMTFASVFTMVAISIDRFWCVTWSMHYRVNNSKRKVTGILIFVWLCVVGIWTPPFISDRQKNTDDANKCIWEPDQNREFVIFVAVIGHYIPCLLMIFAYLRVYFVMRKQARLIATNMPASRAGPSSVSNVRPSSNVTEISGTKLGASQVSEDQKSDTHAAPVPQTLQVASLPSEFSSSQMPGSFDQATGAGNSRKGPERSIGPRSRDKKIFVTLTYVLSSYLICWFPFYIAFDTYAWEPDMVPAGLYTFLFWMTYANSTLNPLIYAYTSKEFRRSFMRVLHALYTCKLQ